MYDLTKTSKSWLNMDLKRDSMREARGFAVVKLSVTSTHMPTIYNGYLNRIGVVVRGAKAQHNENKN